MNWTEDCICKHVGYCDGSCQMGKIMEKAEKTYNVDIHMAGDITTAAMVIQRYAAETGLCVTLMPQTFIYTGGREEGFRVGFINYPRFPKDGADILARATDLARNLLVQLGQHSYSIVSPENTYWVSRKPEHQA